MSLEDPLSLLHFQKNYLTQRLKEITAVGGLFALILDKHTEALLLRLFAKDALLRIVTTIDQIDAPRKLQLFLQAIYFVEPLVYNLNCISADVKVKRYKMGHGLFIPFSQWESEELRFFQSGKFIGNPAVASYFGGDGSTACFVQASMFPLESRVFLTGNVPYNSMPVYYNDNCSEMVLPQIRKAAKAIVNAIIIAEEYPLIRFYALPKATHQAARLPELIADEVQRQLDDYLRANQDYPPKATMEKPRAILLVTDRSMDLFAPLLHEFSYQAMAMDIVESLERESVYKYVAENEKGEQQEMKTDLDDQNDELWVSLRHMHIIEASELIINRINDLIKNNPMMVDRSKAKTSSDLMYVVAHLHGFDEERRLVTLHKTLVDEILDINASRKLAEFAADFEQTCCAEGTSFEGIHNKKLHEDLIELLAREDLHVNDKMRLVLIYGLYRGGLAESDFVKLAKFIGVKNTQIVSLVLRCFYNLHKLDFPIVKKTPKDKKIERQFFHTINNEGTYNTSRFAPGLKRVLYNAAKYELDEDWFPYFRDKPIAEDIPKSNGINSGLDKTNSVRNPRVKASWAPSASRPGGAPKRSKTRQRIFCYVAGGITYSEMRLVYELSQALDKDIYLGSESVLRPRDFLIGLQNIDQVKQPDLLEIPLYDDLVRPRTRAPSYLLDVPKPPPQAVPSPSPNSHPPASSAASQQSFSKSSQFGSSGLGSVNPNPDLPPDTVSSNTPLHYQKRTSQYTTDLSGEGRGKEKKPSRLKRLFK